MIPVSTQVPVYLQHRHHLASTMDLVYYWATWLLIFETTNLAFYSPSSGEDLSNEMPHVSQTPALLKAWMILVTMATATYITKTTTNILVWLHVVVRQKCLHLQERLHSLFKSIVGCVDYWQIHLQYGHMQTSLSIYGIPTAEIRCNDLPTYPRPELPPSYLCTSVRRRSRLQAVHNSCLYTTVHSARCLYRNCIKVYVSPWTLFM